MKEYMTLGTKRVRVEANWNAMVAFLRLRGTDSIKALADFDDITTDDVPKLMAACINEGERMDGRPADYTPEALGASCGLMEVTEFMNIYSRQITPQVPASKEGGAGKK